MKKYTNNLCELPEQTPQQIVKKWNENFIAFCVEGSLEKIRHLFNSSEISKYMDVHYQDDGGFLLACANGHLEIVQYLLTSPELTEHVDIHTNKDLGVLNACWRNNLDLFKYLYTSPELKEHANIHAQKDRAFQIACQHNHLELARFLIFDMNIKQTSRISRYLEENDSDEIKKYFEIRKLNEKLDKKLPIKEKQNNKRMKL